MLSSVKVGVQSTSNTDTYAHACMHALMHTCAHTHTHIQTFMLACTHMYACMHMHVHTHACMQTHTHIHTHTRTSGSGIDTGEKKTKEERPSARNSFLWNLAQVHPAGWWMGEALLKSCTGSCRRRCHEPT